MSYGLLASLRWCYRTRPKLDTRAPENALVTVEGIPDLNEPLEVLCPSTNFQHYLAFPLGVIAADWILRLHTLQLPYLSRF